MALKQKDYTEEDFFGYLDQSNTTLDDPDNVHYNAQCPNCKRTYNLVHNDCGEYLDLCSCPEEDLDTVYHCGHCLITFDRAQDWQIQTEYLQDLEAEQEKVNPYDYDLFDGPSYLGTAQTNLLNYVKCNHKHHEVQLPDNTKIYCSSAYDKSNIDPDFGLYADHIWNPSWRNEFIAWPDGSLPTNRPLALRQIREAFQLAQTDKMVEIGCIGGHGRTGTILALMYLLSCEGLATAQQAIDFVKDKYCKHAIETPIQEWYVKYAANVWFEEELPDEPHDWNSDHCTPVEHIAMVLRGHSECIEQGANCKFFEDDAAILYRNQKDGSNEKIIELAITKLIGYDLAYGGVVLSEDPVMYPCSPLDHYAMIMKGHEKCIRIGEKCDLWEEDVDEYNEKGSIGGVDFWNITLEGSAQDIYDSYPTAEQLQEVDKKDE